MKQKLEELKLQAAMNRPSQSTRIGVCCCRGVLHTLPDCLIIVYASLNCLDSAGRKKLNVISCVQHVAL